MTVSARVFLILLVPLLLHGAPTPPPTGNPPDTDHDNLVHKMLPPPKPDPRSVYNPVYNILPPPNPDSRSAYYSTSRNDNPVHNILPPPNPDPRSPYYSTGRNHPSSPPACVLPQRHAPNVNPPSLYHPPWPPGGESPSHLSQNVDGDAYGGGHPPGCVLPQLAHTPNFNPPHHGQTVDSADANRPQQEQGFVYSPSNPAVPVHLTANDLNSRNIVILPANSRYLLPSGRLTLPAAFTKTRRIATLPSLKIAVYLPQQTNIYISNDNDYYHLPPEPGPNGARILTPEELEGKYNWKQKKKKK